MMRPRWTTATDPESWEAAAVTWAGASADDIDPATEIRHGGVVTARAEVDAQRDRLVGRERTSREVAVRRVARVDRHLRWIRVGEPDLLRIRRDRDRGREARDGNRADHPAQLDVEQPDQVVRPV